MSGRRDLIEHWIGDFLGSTRFADSKGLLREYAPEVLSAFLTRACAARDVDPAELEEGEMKPALLEGVARIELPASVREGVPTLCAAFLEEMEGAGRLSGGRALGLYVKALKPAYLDAAAGKAPSLQRPAAKIGRNDACPCGSGLKYKRCCLKE